MFIPILSKAIIVSQLRCKTVMVLKPKTSQQSCQVFNLSLHLQNVNLNKKSTVF